MSNTSTLDEPKRALLAKLHSSGINDLDVLAALQVVPREEFIDPEQRSVAYENRPLPVGQGQTISQPYIIARMTEALATNKDCRVLEIGTGSGYQTAILARLSAEVFTIERFTELSEGAQNVLARLGYKNIRFKIGDGTLGWPEEAPFDRIIVTASGPQVPTSLSTQLADGGKLVMPIESPDVDGQRLYLFTKHGTDLEPTFLCGCRFVPLIGAEGWAEGEVE